MCGYIAMCKSVQTATMKMKSTKVQTLSAVTLHAATAYTNWAVV